jgi:hypothetical protein
LNPKVSLGTHYYINENEDLGHFHAEGWVAHLREGAGAGGVDDRHLSHYHHKQWDFTIV